MFCQFLLSSSAYSTLGLAATYALVVDDLDNGCEPSSVRTGAEEDDTADLDVPPLAGGNRCGHFGCGSRLVVLRINCQDVNSKADADVALTTLLFGGEN